MKQLVEVLVGAAFLVAVPIVACSDSAGDKASSSGGADAGGDGEVSFDTGEELKVAVPATGRVYVKLKSPPAIVTPADPKTDLSWDIAFEGLEAYTNSGPSGPGGVQAFGPLDAVVFLDDVAPAVPFVTADKTGGAFIRWWFYDGENHALNSRFHIYGVKDGDKTYKVQVLGYYGERDGAPVSALYRVRWQDVNGGEVKDVPAVDGTAGGPNGGADAPSECLDLGTGAKTALAPSVARTSSAWHLCFRRQDISVNGELGGPRNVGAVDLDADKTAKETLGDIVNRTAESEKARFDSVNAQSMAGQQFRGDRVVSAFTGLWIEKGSSPVAPRKAAWYAMGSDGKSKYLIGFARFEGASDQSPGTIVMRVKPVK